MTIIKYATVANARGTDRILILRGKKSGKVGHLPDGDNPFGLALYAEEVAQLPREMTPSEYDEFIDGLDVGNDDSEVAETYRRVRDEIEDTEVDR